MINLDGSNALRVEFGFINGPLTVVRTRQPHEAKLLADFVNDVRARGGVHIAEVAKLTATDLDQAFDFEFSNELYWLRHYAAPRYVDGLAPCTVAVNTFLQ